MCPHTVRRGWYDPEEEEYAIELPWDQDPGYGGDNISQDVEGLTIYYADVRDEDGYLIASSQGDDTFGVFEREADEDGDNDCVGSFKIGTGVVDGSEVCDGEMVINVPLGSSFPQGPFVFQDGQNTPVALGPAVKNVRTRTSRSRFGVRSRRRSPIDLDIDTAGYNPRR